MSPEIEAILLCGGRGSRMGEVTKDKQKALLPVDGKPLLEHILENVRNAFGSARVILATGWHGEDIKGFFGSRFGNLHLEYVHNPGLIGTKRRFLLGKELLRQPFLYLAGDNICYFQQLINVAESFERDSIEARDVPKGLVGVLSGAADHSPGLTHALITVEGRKVTEILHPPPETWEETQYRELHVHYFNPKVFDFVAQTAPQIMDMPQALSQLVHSGTLFTMQEYKLRWYHFVTPRDFEAILDFG